MENRLFGPPGTGKTTWLAERSIPKAVDKHGSDKVVVTSFTKAAAQEVTGRGLLVNDNGVGTLHALCYRGLGFPELMTKKIKEWNQAYPEFYISGSKVSSLDEGGGVDAEGNGQGDKLLAKLNIYRSKLIPEEMWTTDVQHFNQIYKYHKYDIHTKDFTDLIVDAINEDLPPPNDATMMFVDEAQDLTPLQLKLIRKWGKPMKHYMLVGDDDQTIYSFTGASPDAFLKPPVPDKQKMILGQSYRVPRQVLEKSMDLIEQVQIREPKNYSPRVDKDGNTVEGLVTSLPEHFNEPIDIINELNENVQAGKTSMILTSCSYMLDTIKKELILAKIPFGNKYRTTRGDWNPLAPGGHNRISARDLLHNFLTTGIDAEFWNIHQFLMWTKNIRVCNTGIKYKTGKKVLKKLQKMLEENEPGMHSCRDVIDMVLTPDAKKMALKRDVQWFMENVATKRLAGLDFPITIYNKYQDINVLNQQPLVTIGTIHSVKGGQADYVYLYPDISYAAEEERQKTLNAEDALKRLFYVGMTRAREKLITMEPYSKNTRQGNKPVLYVRF